jgi:hypothetical protein
LQVGQSTINGYDFQYSILAGVFPFFVEVLEYVDRSAVLSLAVQNGVKVHKKPSSTRIQGAARLQKETGKNVNPFYGRLPLHWLTILR